MVGTLVVGASVGVMVGVLVGVLVGVVVGALQTRGKCSALASDTRKLCAHRHHRH